MNLFLLCIFSVILGSILLEETDAHDKNFIDLGLEYIDRSIEVAPIELFTEPKNNFNSIKYALYTPSNPREACYFEPTPEEFDNCPFDSNRKTEFLIHGFAEILKPGNLFENHTGADPQQFHCIGHSLGAHVCGVAARQILNFNRVSGLDPGGIVPFLQLLGKNIELKYTDADYVDVIHTSVLLTTIGLGIIQPVGDIDFYVDGGINQNHCKFGRKYIAFNGAILKVLTTLDLALCNHYISIEYFIYSVNETCVFLGTKCGSVVSAVLKPVIKSCSSNSSLTAKMGFHSKKIQALPPNSVFSVETNEFPPYCKDKNEL